MKLNKFFTLIQACATRAPSFGIAVHFSMQFQINFICELLVILQNTNINFYLKHVELINVHDSQKILDLKDISNTTKNVIEDSYSTEK